jgi:hypothetical protein
MAIVQNIEVKLKVIGIFTIGSYSQKWLTRRCSYQLIVNAALTIIIEAFEGKEMSYVLHRNSSSPKVTSSC